MRRLNRSITLSVGALALLAIAAYAVNNTWVNFQPASNVIGQANFSGTVGGSALDQLSNPYGVAIDPITNKVFVADTGNNRILRYAAGAATTNGATAEAVFGNSGFVNATGTNTPTGIAFDANGNLWVADFGNNRVLRFPGAGNLISGSGADVVLGQSSFGNNTPTATANGVNGPTGIFIDSGDHMWVGDSVNNRVLRFNNATTLTTGTAATAVLGEPGFPSGPASLSQTGMNVPLCVTADNAVPEHLWVCDSNNSRVLRFDNAPNLGNGAPASAVLGELNFTSTAGTGSNQGLITTPGGVAVDSNGRLYVADDGQPRVLIFNNAAALGNGANANNVLGQPDFNTFIANNGADPARWIHETRRIAWNEPTQSLFVTDRLNSRVVRFTPQITSAANVTVSGRVTNARGNALRGVTVTITDSRGNRFKATTNAFGYYTFASVPAGDTYIATAASRGMTFAPRITTVNDAVSDLNFTPQ